MSATGRSDVRRPDDAYNTPSWCVRRLLERVYLPKTGRWLEPCAGNGALIKAANAVVPDLVWDAIDIAPRADGIRQADFLTEGPWSTSVSTVITNPPFSLAREFVERSFEVAPKAWIAMLMRLNWAASEERFLLMKMRAPDLYVLPNRPSFTDDGRTDSTEYAWMVWPPSMYRRPAGFFEVLDLTPLDERKAG
jgi:hypothetical protein